MKLTKLKLINLTKEELMKLGYQYVKDTLTGANGLFIKKVEPRYFLTLGLTISRYYDTQFTASFYLSKCTRWSSVWGDIPRESYERVGYFLSSEERKFYLNEHQLENNIQDLWWDANDPKAFEKFINIIKITEKRFLAQKDLLTKIENSLEIQELSKYALEVIAIAETTKCNIIDINYQFQPQKIIDDIPLHWFKASEMVIIKNKAILNANTVKLLAADSWRQKIFSTCNRCA